MIRLNMEDIRRVEEKRALDDADGHEDEEEVKLIEVPRAYLFDEGEISTLLSIFIILCLMFH